MNERGVDVVWLLGSQHHSVLVSCRTGMEGVVEWRMRIITVLAEMTKEIDLV